MKILKVVTILLFSVIVSNGQTTKRGIDIKMGYNSPVFNFNDSYDGGLGLNIGILYPFNTNIIFTLNSGYIKWGFDNTAFNLKNSNDRYTNFNIDAPISIIPITFGIKYFATNSNVRPYLSAEFGFFYYSQTANGTYTLVQPPSNVGVEYTLPELKDSGFRTMLNFGAGTLVPINNEFSFDFSVKINALLNAQSVSGSNNSGAVEGNSSTLFYFSLAVGVNYYFEKG